MAYENFKPEIWSEQILMARDAMTVGVQNSWRAFDGDVQQAGDKVHIQGLVGATIKDLTGSTIDDPEDVQDQSMELIVSQKKYFNFKVDDVDRLQANIDVKNHIIRKTGNDLAKIQDKLVYTSAVNGAGYVQALTSATSSNIIAGISSALAWLKSNDVMDGISIEFHPYIFALIQQAILAIQNPNPDVVKNGLRGTFLGAEIYETPRVLVTSDTAGATDVAPGTSSAYYHCIVRTKEAIAYAEKKHLSTEAYRIEKGFGDGVKGLAIYDSKVVKPAELVNFRVQI